MWSKKTMQTNSNSLRSAPSTIFTTALSPRQIANKAYTLGFKKLERDNKRSKQKYHVRERLLINNTITKAEQALNSRTRRTNRRVMAAEDENEDALDEFLLKIQPTTAHHHHQSPLIQVNQEEENIPYHIPSSFSNTFCHQHLHRDYRSDTLIIPPILI